MEASDFVNRFATDLGVSVESVQANAELVHLTDQAMELLTKDQEVYLSYFTERIERSNPTCTSACLSKARSVLQQIRDNLDHQQPSSADYLSKSFPQQQSYLFLRPEGKGLFPEIVAEAMHIATSDWIMLQEMKKHGFRSAALNELENELKNDAIAVAIRLKRNAYEKIEASSSLSTSGSDGVPLGTHPEYKAILPSCVGTHPIEPGHQLIGLVLAGGRSTRVRTTIPKALLYLGNKSMLDHVIDNLRLAGATKILVGVGHRSKIFQLALEKTAECIVLNKALGMGFRSLCALESIRDYEGSVILTYCDMPFISATSMSRLAEMHRQNQNLLSLLSSYATSLSGQVIRLANGNVVQIIQQRLHSDISSKEKDVGGYLFENTVAFRKYLACTKNDNYRGEYYFADVVNEIARLGGQISALTIPIEECLSVNTPRELCKARLVKYLEQHRNNAAIPIIPGLNRDTFLSLQFFERYGGIKVEDYIQSYKGKDLECKLNIILQQYEKIIDNFIGSLIDLGIKS